MTQSLGPWEAVIGLEIHCQLATDSKIFCSCKARLEGERSVADEVANANTCPVCAGHPGTLPVMNEKAIEYAVRAGLSMNCGIRSGSVFARKNYFYPDLPKGYQISQYEMPICEKGWIELPSGKRLGIQRIHLEEDAGKSTHHSIHSLVNLNRAGVPLVEIVTQPDLSSAQEAAAAMRGIYEIVTFLGINDGNLQEGNFRCDANVSVRRRGETRLGTRTEIKNINSFRFVERAVEYEIRRQIGVLESGDRVVQETRSYDADQDRTLSMRSKEEAEDYRYFPDPDLLPLTVSEALLSRVRGSLPELPHALRTRWQKELQLSEMDTQVLTGSKTVAEFFARALDSVPDAKTFAKTMASLLTTEVLRLQKESSISLTTAKFTPGHLAEVAAAVQGGTISTTGAKQVIAVAWETGDSVGHVIQTEGLAQVSDLATLEPVVNEVIQAHPQQVQEYRAGKEKLIGFFVGQAMKRMGGKANPGLLQNLILKQLRRE